MLHHAAILLCLAVSTASTSTDFEANLLKHLKNISDFSPTLFPRINKTMLNISVNLLLSHIVSVDTAKQSLKISAYLQVGWEDERLVWNSTNFGGTKATRWDAAQIWHPMILVYNGNGVEQALAPQTFVGLTSINEKLTRVQAYWRREFEFYCDFKMVDFPFDRHRCEFLLFFSDLNYYAYIQPVLANPMEKYNALGIYKDSSEWTLTHATEEIIANEHKLWKNAEAIPIKKYSLILEMERISTYYVVNVFIPLLLLTLVQVLAYFVPLESGEKLGFGITIMLSYTMFLILLDDIIPKSQDMPAIALFITAAMVLSTVSLLLTSLTMRFHFTPRATRMSACARAIFVRFLGRLLCVNQVASADRSAQNKPGDVGDATLFESDWAVATCAIERFLSLFGVAATAVIIGVFVLKSYSA